MPCPCLRRLHAALLAVALLCLTAGAAQAQLMASERGRVWQMISGTEIEVDYARPSVRGRSPVFGGIVPWGEVWTPGANDNTTLRVSKAIELNGVEIPAGKYGLWMEVNEEGPWTLVVHADTTLFHTQHPKVDDGLYAIPLERVVSPDFLETLTFTLEAIRPTSAELRLTWGDVRVPMKLGIDPGIETEIAPEVAAALEGEWLLDDAAALPSDEELKQWTEGATPAQIEATLEWVEVMRKLERPRTVRLERNPRTGTLSFLDPAQDAAFASLYEGEEGPAAGEYGTILLPRAEGVFALAFAINGELVEFDPRTASLLEFEFDWGRAVRFTLRGPDDEVEGTGVRPPA